MLDSKSECQPREDNKNKNLEKSELWCRSTLKNMVTKLPHHNKISEQPVWKSSQFESSNPHNLQRAIFGENKENTKEKKRVDWDKEVDSVFMEEIGKMAKEFQNKQN